MQVRQTGFQSAVDRTAMHLKRDVRAPWENWQGTLGELQPHAGETQLFLSILSVLTVAHEMHASNKIPAKVEQVQAAPCFCVLL
jgi:hypothetical protein